MINVFSYCKNGSALLLTLAALTGPVAAQDFGTALLFGLGQKAITEGKDLLNEAPGMMDNMLSSAEEGKTYETPQACLGALQVAVNAGAVAANLLPFSSVTIFEDRRGPVGRFRMMVNGEKVHIEAFCDEAKLSAEILPWGRGDSTPVVVTTGSLDAATGLLLLLRAQGAFEDDVADVSAEIEAPAEPVVEEELTYEEIVEQAAARKREREERARMPMTSNERDALRSSIQQCWNVGSLSSEALRVTITVSFSISRQGWPETDTIRLLDSSSDDEEATIQAFNSARQAITRCGAAGLDLPLEKYEQWKDTELSFYAGSMRIR